MEFFQRIMVAIALMLLILLPSLATAQSLGQESSSRPKKPPGPPKKGPSKSESKDKNPVVDVGEDGCFHFSYKPNKVKCIPLSCERYCNHKVVGLKNSGYPRYFREYSGCNYDGTRCECVVCPPTSEHEEENPVVFEDPTTGCTHYSFARTGKTTTCYPSFCTYYCTNKVAHHHGCFLRDHGCNNDRSRCLCVICRHPQPTQAPENTCSAHRNHLPHGKGPHGGEL